MKKLLTFAFMGWILAWTANSADAAPPVPESVVWEEAIEYSNPDDTHLQLNLARPKSGDGPSGLSISCLVTDYGFLAGC